MKLLRWSRRARPLGRLLLLLLLALLLGGPRSAEAGQPSPRRRQETITETLYEWWLVPWATPKQAACRLQINHPDRPTGLDVLRFCGEDLYNAWVATPPCEAALTGGDVTTCKGLYLYFVGQSRVTHEVTRTYPPPSIELHLENCTPAFPHFRCPDPTMLRFVGVERFPGARITALTVAVSGQGKQTCTGAECYVPLNPNEGQTTTYTLRFSATSSLGDASPRYQATVRLTPQRDGSLLVDVLSDAWADPGVDRCAQAWNLLPPTEPLPDWLNTPDAPADLATDVPYLYLAGRLIAHGIVDASSCSDGGLLPNGAASLCGIALAKEEVLAWQNLFDEDLWRAAREVGLPAVLFKRLLAHESQFWPAEFPQRQEVGFGQLSPHGLDTLLLWEPEIAQPLCEEMLGEWRCVYGYAHLNPLLRHTLYESVWAQANLACQDCPYGIDLTRSGQAVELFAHLIRAHCRQIGQTVHNITYRSPASVSGYADLWRFTLANYNGPDCIYEALRRTWQADEPLDWDHVRGHFPQGCEGVVSYVETLAP